VSHACYADRADLYDKIYAWKDYESEARRLRQLLLNAGVEEGARVLEVACGSGPHMHHLVDTFETTGTDLNEPMLALARERLPDVTFFPADMAELRVEEPFDALLCLFSSIGYMHGIEPLARAARAFAAALMPGGVVVIEPWLSRDMFVDGTPSLYTWEDDKLKLARASVVRAEGRKSVLEFHWMVARRGQGVERFTERHELWMFNRSEYLDAFRGAGFEMTFHSAGLSDNRGLYVGRKRMDSERGGEEQP